MVNKVRTLDFLPEVFRTESNRQFLNATLDVLTAQPNLNRVQGYIGTKYGYGVNADDKYVVEPTVGRSNYQFDPSVVFLKPDTQQATDFIDYSGIVKAINNFGGQTYNHDRLFNNEFYSWDPFIDYDKIVNFSQYYWIPYGPDAVLITNRTIFLEDKYLLSSSKNEFKLTDNAGSNPIINLLRGGTYTFELETSLADEQLWIQGVPGLSGYETTTNTREILGVTENGTRTITFTVPESDAQSAFNIPGNLSVDLVTTKLYSEINNSSITTIDGISEINGKTLLFYNSENRKEFYTIQVNNNTVSLTAGSTIPATQKIIVNSGVKYAGQIFYRTQTDTIAQIPYLSAVLNKLYYQSSVDEKRVGQINIFETNAAAYIDVNDIIGKKTYTSSNGVTFTNGLKIKFDNSVVPASYADKEYYVDDVGTSIKLLEVSKYAVTELSSELVYNLWDDVTYDLNRWDSDLYAPMTPDYITINRNSRDLNAWTRSNRWFHQSVIDTTVAALGYVSAKGTNKVIRAQRPIIEFRGNLQLFGGGNNSGGAVTYFDNSGSSLINIVGKTSYQIDGIELLDGDRIVLATDDNTEVRKNVYVVEMISTNQNQSAAITLNPVLDLTIADQTEINVLFGSAHRGTTWKWDLITNSWVQTQKKIKVNQPPLFDIVDDNLNSLSNTTYYGSTNFKGSMLFSYTTGVGVNDFVLGFPISYSSLNNIGDINFTVNFNDDTFTYYEGNVEINSSVNIGYVKHNITSDTSEKLTGWVPATDTSFQYQVLQYALKSGDTTIVCDIPAKLTTSWNPIQIYLEDTVLDSADYAVTVENNKTIIKLSAAIQTTSTATVLIYSDSISENAYYTVPSNLLSNPFNTNITSVDVGDIRNQYRTIFSNAPEVTGAVFGTNNIHDLGQVYQYGTSIIQSSSSLVLPGIFLRKSDASLFDALQYCNNEYYNYKTLLVDIAYKNDYSVYQTPYQILDNIIHEIVTIKNKSTSFFWTDMLYSGSPYVTNTYKFEVAPTSNVFSLSRIYDFSSANYNAIGIYLTRKVSGQSRTTQLIRNIDYIVSSTGPTIEIITSLTDGDEITINEYNQTYGSYCPSTPSALGLYPSFAPEIIEDKTYGQNAYFIVGHDGSYNKLYGNYVNGALDDFRDIALFEFEKRIYNNIKSSGTIPLSDDTVIPGQFRNTEYSRDEILNIYSTNFLNWVGTNRLDFRKQYYNVGSSFSYNYNQSSNRLTNTALAQGYWRGIYRWLYDTDHPHDRPWEMLGLTSKPTWWDTRYGQAPYTSDNLYMWKDIAAGYIWNSGDAYTNKSKIRPELLKILPVDSLGQLKSPLNVVVGNHNKLTFNRDWIVGDQAPTENAYLKSSSWPFDLVRILALTKPAQFFNLFADLDSYKWNSEFKQYLYNNRYHLDCRELNIHGSGTAKRSYINWIVDYINVRGVSGHEVVTNYLRNIDVRLTYKAAGFSSKNYLKFYVERATPDSKNTGFLIPDESYSILLYNSVWESKIDYSSIIFQRVKNGWTVWGNNQSQQYFKTAVPKTNSKYTTINFGSTQVKIGNSWYEDREQIISYGTLFHSQQAISEFINNYGQYLITQGVEFDNISNGVSLNWNRMIQEFLAWSQQEWEYGSTIAINPNARKFTVNKPGLVVQPITIQDKNFVLNQNLIPIQAQNSAVYRNNEQFTIEILNEGDTVANTNLHLNSIEHAVVFDNSTVFGDLIYNLVTGLRQQRLLLRGYKTAEWSGYVDAAGFIINEDNIKEWASNIKYPKGSIVTHKGLYWSANKLLEPTLTFVQSDWKQIDYENVKTGLLSNPSTNAYQSLYYYDSYNANLKQDEDLLAFSLIGYRPRNYLASADLSDITQINVFKNIIAEKGTIALAESFKNTVFDQGSIDYDIKEIWAVNTNTFGSVLNSNFVEFKLNQSFLTGNPTLIEISDETASSEVQQTVLLNELTNWGRPPTSKNFLPKQTKYSEYLPSAGYVDVRDTDYQVYEFEDLNDEPSIIDSLSVNKILWIAKYKSSWNIYSASPLGANCIQVDNNQNGTLTIIFDRPHNLNENEHFAINNFDPLVNKFYTVDTVKSLTSVVVSYDLDNTVVRLSGFGIGFKLVSRRFNQASDAVDVTAPYSEYSTRKIWVDTDSDDRWAVYASSMVFNETQLEIPQSTDVGSAVSYSEEIGYLYADATESRVYCYNNDNLSTLTGNSNFGKVVKTAADKLFIASNSNVYYYDSRLTLNQILPEADITDIACGTNSRWLYLLKKSTSELVIYHLDNNNNYVLVSNTGNSVAYGNATSIASSIDGRRLIVGAATETVNELSNAGAVYVYSRELQRFISDGISTEYRLQSSVPNNIADVYLNGILTTQFVVSNNLIVLNSAAPTGTIVTVEHADLTLLQVIQADEPRTGAQFGASVDTNRYGSNFVVGCPFDLTTINTVSNIEGSVYTYANEAQRYGTVTLKSPLVVADDVIFFDGYLVKFESDTDSINSITEQINTQTPVNIVATANSSTNSITITVRDRTAETPYDIIDVVANINVVTRLKLNQYTNTQKITAVNMPQRAQFGSVVRMNERDSLIVSAPVTARLSPTVFDKPNSCDVHVTAFDNGVTTFIDNFNEVGMIYQYDYLPAENETISNSGKYVFGQYITTSNTNYGAQSKFGHSVDYRNSTIIVGAPNYSSNANGFVSVFRNQQTSDPCQVINPTSWYVYKKPIDSVDIHKINNISIYEEFSEKTLEYLDYIDPLQGKLLGAVSVNIDVISEYDPAGYESNELQWGQEHVGKIWLNTSNLRILNYNQQDVNYNAKNWGAAFPGSSADVFTWIESNVSPLNYNDSGFPITYDKFVVRTVLNNATNSLAVKYYFWVKNYSKIPNGKTLSPLALAQYILNPQSSGIAYLAPITTNTVALYNSSEYINAASGILHIGYGNSVYVDNKHDVWRLIRTNSDDFLSGFPTAKKPTPTDLYLKYLDSFSGADVNYNFVPDTRLPLAVRSGVSFSPRQTMFVDRLVALENYITYVNNILTQYPVTETRSDLTLLKSVEQSFWKTVNWWASGWSDQTKASIEVERYADLNRIGESELITGTTGLVLTRDEGLVVKIKANSLGLSEYYTYSNSQWKRIGLERGTIQFLSTLWTTKYGWDSSNWDIDLYDRTNADDIRKVIRWINEVLFTGDLVGERNTSLMLMFNYSHGEIVNQKNYNQWLTKTSLIDVNHKIRGLLPYKKYQRDNQDFLSGYLNEIKPYHVYIKNFVYTYDGIDNYSAEVTDFDLPAVYDDKTNTFNSPRIVYTDIKTEKNQYAPTSDIWKNNNYSQWYQNYGLSLKSVKKENVQIATLTAPIMVNSQSIKLSSVYGLRIGDSIIVNNEKIQFNTVDKINRTLSSLVRGFASTAIDEHDVGDKVYVPYTQSLILDAGRGYTEIPKIDVILDPELYPKPRNEISMTSAISGGSLSSISVLNPGNGYAIYPDIIISSSDIYHEFNGQNINSTVNTIRIENHKFETGDSVIFTVTGDEENYRLKRNGLYYVRSIDNNTVALYDNYVYACQVDTAMEKVETLDTHRVKLSSTSSTIFGKLTVTARAQFLFESYPIRTIKTTIAFDRVSYTSNNGWDGWAWEFNSWDSEERETAAYRIDKYYKPTVNMSGKDLKQLMNGVSYPTLILQSSTFADNSSVDVKVVAPTFTMTTNGGPADGGDFLDGYGPEELVAGYITDSIKIVVKSNDGCLMPTATVSSTRFITNVLYTGTITVSNATAASISGKPSWLSITDEKYISGKYIFTLSGIPSTTGEIIDVNVDAENVCKYSSTSTVEDLAVISTTVILLPCVAPTVGKITPNSFRAMIPYEGTLTIENATDADILYGLPTGVSIFSEGAEGTGYKFVLKGTPTISNEEYEIKVKAQNGTGSCSVAYTPAPSVSAGIGIVAEAPSCDMPEIGELSTTTIQAYVVYNATLTITNAKTPVIIAGLPSTIIATQTQSGSNVEISFRGTPLVSEQINLSVKASNTGEQCTTSTATKPFELSVNPAIDCAAPVVGLVTPNVFKATIQYNGTITVANATSAQIISGLPSGISIASQGAEGTGYKFTLSGKPTLSDQAYDIRVTAQNNSVGCKPTTTLAPSVSAGSGTVEKTFCPTPELPSLASDSFQAFVNYGPTILTVTNATTAPISGLPKGITATYSTSNGNVNITLSGKPTEVGKTWNATITAVNACGGGRTTSSLAQTQIGTGTTGDSPPCVTPVIGNLSTTTIQAYLQYSASLTITNATSASVTVEPSSLTVTQNRSGTNIIVSLLGTPTVSGKLTISISATNTGAECTTSTAVKAIELTVASPPACVIPTVGQLTSLNFREGRGYTGTITVSNATSANIVSGLPAGISATFSRPSGSSYLFTLSGQPPANSGGTPFNILVTASNSNSNCTTAAVTNISAGTGTIGMPIVCATSYPNVTVTGATSGGTVYATQGYANTMYYRHDSNIAMAAVHAGLISVGETATFRISTDPGYAQGYPIITRNGVTSTANSTTGGCAIELLYICPTPTVGSISNTNFYKGSSYSGTITVTNATSASVTGLPAGIGAGSSVSGSNVIITLSGTPTGNAGTSFTLQITSTNAATKCVAPVSGGTQTVGTFTIQSPPPCTKPVVGQLELWSGGKFIRSSSFEVSLNKNETYSESGNYYRIVITNAEGFTISNSLGLSWSGTKSGSDLIVIITGKPITQSYYNGVEITGYIGCQSTSTCGPCTASSKVGFSFKVS